MNVFAQLTRLQFRPATASVHSGGDLQVELSLKSLMPVSVRIQQLAASIHFDVDHGGTLGRSKGAQRLTNSGTIEFSLGNSSAGLPSSAAPRPVLELDEVQDRSPSDNSLNSTGVVCKNTHLLMRRHESSSLPETPNCVSPPTVAMKEGAQMLKVQDVMLEPGNNSIVFTAPVRWSLGLLSPEEHFCHLLASTSFLLCSQSGQPGSYMLRQLCATVGQVQFVQSHIYPSVRYEVYSQEPQLTVEPLSGLSVLFEFIS